MAAGHLGQLPEGWLACDAEAAAKLHKELQTELPDGHALHGLALELVARRDGSDDVLCRHPHGPERYTVVHLTWAMRQEADPRFPSVEADGDFAAFLEYGRGLCGR